MRLTNFFVAQRYYTRMSQLLYGLFILVVLVQFLLLLLLVGGITYALTGELGVSLLLWSCALLGGYLLLGVIIGQQKIKQGGMSIAKQTHAVRLFIHQDSEQQPVFSSTFIRVATIKQLPASYQRYYEFAEQMSIASGVPLPKLYVLPFEMGVNAFVAGFDTHDTVMVLTQGAVEKLTNTELYGLLGHEFGHIIHGDARLNLRIYVYLTMLGWVYDLADVLEEGMFGKFNSNYHHESSSYQFGIASPALPAVHDKKAWVAYLRQSHGVAIQDNKLSNIRSNIQESQAYAFMAYLMAALPLVALRLFGVIGMAFAEWIKQQFNHQREFLADATSVQLTRSPDVVEALVGLQKRYSTALSSSAFTTGMSHFFFANPKDLDDKLAYSHPKIAERLEVLTQDFYVDFGKEMTAKMDVQKLDDAQHFAHQYDYVAEGWVDKDDKQQCTQNDDVDDIKVIEFVAEPEVVIDGRLVVDGWQKSKSYPVYPQRATCHPVFADDFDAHTEHITLETIKTISLPWQMVKALRTMTGTLAMIESVLLCHYHDTVWLHSKVHMHQIYQPMTKPATPVLPHNLSADLLQSVAAFDRRLDGLLLTISLQRLLWHTNQMSQTALMVSYQKGFEQLLSSDDVTNKMAFFDKLSFDHQMLITHRIQGDFEVMYRAVVMAAVWRLLAGNMPTSANITQRRQTLLGHLVPTDIEQSASCVLMMVLFLATVQDNSLYLCRYDRLIDSVRRWGLLLQITLPSDTVLITLMHQVWVLDEMDWLVLLFGATDTNPQPVLETICTALVYNGQLGQREYDLLSALVVFWQGEMPVV